MTLSGASFAGPISSDEAVVAWAWVNVSGSTPSFTPSIFYQHTPTGAVITAERTAQGRFTIDFGSMPFTGALHATAYGGDHTAVIEYWGTSGGSLKGQ